ARKLRWSWRAMVLPKDGNECGAASDSAAAVYVAWRRGLRWHVLKYVWSATVAKGSVCDRKRNPILAQDSIVLETGGPVGFWKTEEIDLAVEFRKHFGENAPDLKGV